MHRGPVSDLIGVNDSERSVCPSLPLHPLSFLVASCKAHSLLQLATIRWLLLVGSIRRSIIAFSHSPPFDQMAALLVAKLGGRI